jgi:hypothetical protein
MKKSVHSVAFTLARLLYQKRTLSVTLLSLSLFSANSHAEQNYQTELLLGYEKEDADTSTEKTLGLSAEIYFSPVNTENKPLAQAAFLDKSSSAIVGYIDSKTDLQNSTFNSIELSGPLISINYITEANAFIFGATYSKLDGDTNPNIVEIDGSLAGFSIGKYLNDSSAVNISYASSEAEYRDTASNQTIITLDIDYYEFSYNIIQSIGTASYYRFNAGIELINKSDSSSVKEDNHELEVLGEYYFTRMTSLGAAASFNSGDDVSDEGKTLAIGFTHFFMPQFAINIDLTKFNADDSQTEDTDSISVEAIARF